MSEITRYTQAIRAKRDEITGIKSELDRCEICIAALVETKEALAALKHQRKEAVTAAFMAGKEADTGEVDKMLRGAEKAASGAADIAAGAQGAKEVLQERLATAEEALDALLTEQREAGYGAIEEEFKAAEIAYTEAAEALHAAVTKMMACTSVSYNFRPLALGSSPLRDIMRRFYIDGLTVNRGRHLPESFGSRFMTRAEELATPEAQRLIDKLQAEGLDLSAR